MSLPSLTIRVLFLSVVVSLLFSVGVVVAWADSDESIRRIVVFENGSTETITAVDDEGLNVSPYFAGFATERFIEGDYNETPHALRQRARTHVKAQISSLLEFALPTIRALGFESMHYSHQQAFQAYHGREDDSEDMVLHYSVKVDKQGNVDVFDAGVRPVEPKYLMAYYSGNNNGMWGLPPDFYDHTYANRLYLSLQNADGVAIDISERETQLTLHAQSQHPTAWAINGEYLMPQDQHECVLGTLPDSRQAVGEIVEEHPQHYSLTLNGTVLTAVAMECPDYQDEFLLGAVTVEHHNIVDAIADNSLQLRSHGVVGIVYGVVDYFSIAPSFQSAVSDRTATQLDDCSFDFTTEWQYTFTPQADITYYVVDTQSDEWTVRFLKRHSVTQESGNPVISHIATYFSQPKQLRIKREIESVETVEDNHVVTPIEVGIENILTVQTAAGTIGVLEDDTLPDINYVFNSRCR